MDGFWIRLSSNIKKERMLRRLYFLVIGMSFMEKKNLLPASNIMKKFRAGMCTQPRCLSNAPEFFNIRVMQNFTVEDKEKNSGIGMGVSHSLMKRSPKPNIV